MRRISPVKVAASVNLVLGLWHLLRVTLVVTGLAKPFMNFALRLHFIEPAKMRT